MSRPVDPIHEAFIQSADPQALEQKKTENISAITTVPPQLHETEEQIFRLQVQVDMQRERELLYKAVLVIEVIIALVLLRAFSLWFFR